MPNRYQQDFVEFLDMVSEEVALLEEIPEHDNSEELLQASDILSDEFSDTESVLSLADTASRKHLGYLLQARSHSAIPQIIFDTNLKICWRNAAYRRFRETPGLRYDYQSRTFDDYYTTFSDKSEEASKERENLFAALRDASVGFSWQGPVEGLGPNLKLFKARLSISPILFNGNGEKPLLYLAVLDDFSTAYRELLHNSFISILNASLLKDEDTGNHINRVKTFSRLLAEELMERKKLGDVRWIDINENFIEDIGILAAFHDVGKIGTSESILLKNGKLDEEEWKVMKEHPTNGALIMASYPNPMAQEIARSHHEKWDGSGYPFGLTGTAIPLSGRIVAVADVYDALRTKRPYKEPFSEEETYKTILKGAGSHFDPGIVDAFKKIRDKFDATFRWLQD